MELRRHWAAVWRRKWLIVAVVAAAVAVTLTVDDVASPEPRYRATATLLVTTPPGQQPVYPPNAIRTPRVVRAAIHDAGLSEDPHAVLDRLSVKPRPGTGLVDVSVEHPRPAAAARLANASVDTYLGRLAEATAPNPGTLRLLERAHERLRERAVAIQRSGVGRARKEEDLRWLAVRDEHIARVYADISTRRALGQADVRLLERATPPPGPVKAKALQQAQGLVGVAIVALVGALALAFLLEYIDLRLRTEADAEHATGAPVLAMLPSQRRLRRAARRFSARGRGRKTRGRSGREPPPIPDSRLAEAFQSLRVQIDLVSRERPLDAILVASPWGGWDKTWVTAYLGTVLAQEGSRVVLVSGDLHRPRLEGLFGVEATHGLGEAQADARLDLGSVLRRTWMPNLEVVPAGLARTHTADVLASSGLARILEAAKATADVVIVEAPPVLAGAEAGLLVKHCDTMLLVLRAGETTRDQALAAKLVLEKVRNGAFYLGSVLTGVTEGRAARRYSRQRPDQRSLAGLRGTDNGRMPAPPQKTLR